MVEVVSGALGLGQGASAGHPGGGSGVVDGGLSPVVVLGGCCGCVGHWKPGIGGYGIPAGHPGGGGAGAGVGCGCGHWKPGIGGYGIPSGHPGGASGAVVVDGDGALSPVVSVCGFGVGCVSNHGTGRLEALLSSISAL